MTARTAGRLLLALALLGVVGVVVLRLVTGELDTGLAVVAVVLVVLAVVAVLADERRSRRGPVSPPP